MSFEERSCTKCHSWEASDCTFLLPMGLHFQLVVIEGNERFEMICKRKLFIETHKFCYIYKAGL